MPTAVFLLGKSHGQRSLASYTPWGHKESDMNKVTEHKQADALLTCDVVGEEEPPPFPRGGELSEKSQ